MAEPDPPRSRPIDDARDECARLRQECQVAAERSSMRKAGVETDLRQHDSETVGTLNAQARRPRGLEHSGLLLRRQSCRDDDCGACSFGPQLRDDAGDGIGWSGHDRQVSRVAELPNGSGRWPVFHPRMARIDEEKSAPRTRRAKDCAPRCYRVNRASDWHRSTPPTAE